MIGYALDAFILLFIVIDPVGLVPMFMALTRDEDAATRRQLALRAAGLALAILAAFAVLGEPILQALGISLPAFQIAGGALLFLLAIEMVFARPSGIRFTTEREERETRQRKDIAVFPLAFPLIAGPGAMTTVLLMAGKASASAQATVVVVVVVGLLIAITAGCLLLAPRLMRLLGETGANVFSRLFGVVLAALAVQYVLDGLRAAL